MRNKQAKKLRKLHLPKGVETEYKVVNTKNILVPGFNAKGEEDFATVKRETIVNMTKMPYRMAKRLFKDGLL